jgi:hypothetical protein
MITGKKSLRSLVEHWLSLDPANSVKVVEFRKRRIIQQCYVCVEASNDAGTNAMFFFRHKDGTWRIFPPDRDRPTMRAAAS